MFHLPQLVAARSSWRRFSRHRLQPVVTTLALVALAIGAVLAPAATPVEAVQDSETAAFLSLINNYRAQNGLAQLGVDNSLNNAANWLSADMLSHCVAQHASSCSHTDSTGRAFDQRLRDFGYPAGTSQGAGENIAWGWGGGLTSAQQAFDGWRNSPGHNANMLSGSFKAIGISRSCSSNDCAWVTDFGTAVLTAGSAGGSGGTGGATSPLQLWYSYRRFDNFTTATAAGYLDAQLAGYFLIRTEGYVFPTQVAGTVPLKLYYSYARGDNFTTGTAAGERDAQLAGYFYIRTEGYVYPTQQPGTVPLQLWYNYNRHDNFTTSTAAGSRDAQLAGYFLIRTEGYVFP